VEFTTADLCDAFPHLIQVAEPLFQEYGGIARFAGPIDTLRVFEDNALVRQALESAGRGRVLVVDGGGSLRCALVGGRLAALARSNGWSGLLVNGCVRDSAELGKVPVGIRALTTSPLRSGKDSRGERGVKLAFAGVEFSPEQYLYADEDGILLATRNLLG
jgi:regulator of ribonuclease activity A